MGGFDDRRGSNRRERDDDHNWYSRGGKVGGSSRRDGNDDRRDDRPNRNEFSDKSSHSNRNDRSERSDRDDRRSERSEAANHSDRNDRNDRSDRQPSRNGHSDRNDRPSDRNGPSDRNRSDRNGYGERSDFHSDRNGERSDRQADRNGHGERSDHRNGHGERSDHRNGYGERSDRQADRNGHGERSDRHSDRNGFGERSDRQADRKEYGERSDRHSDRNGYGERKSHSDRNGRSDDRSGRENSRGPSDRKDGRSDDRGRGRPERREDEDVQDRPENDDPSYVHHMDCNQERQRLQRNMNYKRPKNPKLMVDPSSLMKHEVPEFRDMKLPRYLLEGIEATGYEKPTPIQSISIPLGIQGMDLLTVAQTGSGKTLCFLVTMGHRISEEGKDGDCDMRNGKPMSPAGIVITPTRELALQIMAHSITVLDSTYLRICGAYGGVKQTNQNMELEKQCRNRKLPSGADIVVGCPGRLSDLSSSGRISLREISFLVLDEADRLLDMGFQREMDSIVLDSGMPKDRQTLFYSATFDRREVEFASGYLKRDYVVVQQGVDRTFPEAMSVNIQKVDGNSNSIGFDEVREIQRKSEGQVLVFVPTKLTATTWGTKFGKDACVLHGDMSQQAREHSLENFRDGKKKVLVATDVAQRGLDVPDVTDVVSLYCPFNEDDLLHRAGRTARSGRRGNFHLLLDGRPSASLPSIINLMKENNVDVCY